MDWKWPASIAALSVLIFGFKGILGWILEVREMVRAENLNAYLNGERDKP